MKVPLESIYADLDAIVEALSDKARQVVFGVLAFVWIFLAGGDNVPTFGLAASNSPLFEIAALCIASLLIDVLQSLCAYLSSSKVLRDAERTHVDETDYDESNWRRRLQFLFFYLKLILGSVGALWLTVLLSFAIK